MIVVVKCKSNIEHVSSQALRLLKGFGHAPPHRSVDNSIFHGREFQFDVLFLEYARSAEQSRAEGREDRLRIANSKRLQAFQELKEIRAHKLKRKLRVVMQNRLEISQREPLSRISV